MLNLTANCWIREAPLNYPGIREMQIRWFILHPLLCLPLSGHCYFFPFSFPSQKCRYRKKLALIHSLFIKKKKTGRHWTWRPQHEQPASRFYSALMGDWILILSEIQSSLKPALFRLPLLRSLHRNVSLIIHEMLYCQTKVLITDKERMINPSSETVPLLVSVRLFNQADV